VSLTPAGWAPRRDKPVVRKAMVDLTGPVFKHFAALRERWALEDCYRWAHAPPMLLPPPCRHCRALHA